MSDDEDMVILDDSDDEISKNALSVRSSRQAPSQRQGHRAPKRQTKGIVFLDDDDDDDDVEFVPQRRGKRQK